MSDRPRTSMVACSGASRDSTVPGRELCPRWPREAHGVLNQHCRATQIDLSKNAGVRVEDGQWTGPPRLPAYEVVREKTARPPVILRGWRAGGGTRPYVMGTYFPVHDGTTSGVSILLPWHRAVCSARSLRVGRGLSGKGEGTLASAHHSHRSAAQLFHSSPPSGLPSKPPRTPLLPTACHHSQWATRTSRRRTIFFIVGRRNRPRHRVFATVRTAPIDRILHAGLVGHRTSPPLHSPRPSTATLPGARAFPHAPLTTLTTRPPHPSHLALAPTYPGDDERSPRPVPIVYLISCRDIPQS